MLTPSPSPAPSSTRARLPNSVIFRRSRNSWRERGTQIQTEDPLKRSTEVKDGQVLTELTYLHGVKGQVAGDLKLLHEHLLLDVVDADELGLTSRQDRLAVRRVTQRREGPGRTTGMKHNLDRSIDQRTAARTHLPFADCLAVILSVSLRPVSRSWRAATEPVCVAVWGFQKEISPFRVATASC